MTSFRVRGHSIKVAILAATLCGSTGLAHAFKVDTDQDWVINFDNSIQYTMGWRAKDMDPNIGNHLFFGQGDYKFPDKGDMVTNRFQDFIEFQGVYKKDYGFRTSASVWKDFAYNDEAKTNPNSPYFAAFNIDPSGHYSDYTKRYFVQGGEILDAFVFANSEIGGKPVYAKAGKLNQYWGNAYFFGFSNIGYSQAPIDFIKSLTQPGSEIKELFLPRKQVVLSTELAPNLSVTGQYFFEFRPNRYPEGGTYLGFFDIMFNGESTPGALAAYGITATDNLVKPKNNNNNWGLKVNWSPEWVGGDLGFYYRQLDEVDPWTALINPATGHMQNTFAQGVKLFGISYDRSFGNVNTGFELSQRRHTALNTQALAAVNEGAKGTITNFIANTFVLLPKTMLWDTGALLAEISYTHLNDVTGNANLYHGVGMANCVAADNPLGVPGSGGWQDGCSTKNSLAFAMLFDPQWLQVFPGIDLDAPISYTTGIHGNPAYRAGAFYAQESKIYSVGIKATYLQKHTLALQYNGYWWRPGKSADNGLGAGLPAYAGFGGNGAVSLNDRNWLQLTYKTSF